MKVNKLKMRETMISYAFLAPILVFFVIFVLAPMIMGLVTSFFNYTMTDFTFVGLDNYIRMFNDEIFVKSLINTVIIVVGSVPVVVFFSLFVASSTYDKHVISRSFYRFVFFLPVVTGSVAVTVVWKWIYDPLSGILNYVLKTGGIIEQNISWLGDKQWALLAIIIILLTTSVGQPIILYIAAMGNIDNSLVEAARVDGATELQAFWKIKWPSLLPTTLYIAIITTINSFQCFALIQLLTSGGPNYSTSTLMYYLYEKAFKLSEYGYANTMGVFLMKQFSENIPTELLESAKIDGCGEIRTFWNVAFPIIKPGFAALAIFTFINSWNDYFMQLVMLTSRQNLTVSLGVATMQAEMATNYGVIMAGAALAAVPIVTVFLVFQKSFTQGITMGAVKG